MSNPDGATTSPPAEVSNDHRLSHQPHPPHALHHPGLRPTPTKAPVALPKAPAPVVFRTFTPTTLLPYNGTADQPVYLAVRGRVFDVTPGRNFYGPGGPYENFAGRDASRGLACQSFDEEMLTKDLKGPLDTLEDLDADQMENLQSWEERFSEKYLVVGKLVAEGEEGA